MTCIPLLAPLNIEYYLLTCTVVLFSVPHSLYLSFTFHPPSHLSLSSQSCLSTFHFLSIILHLFPFPYSFFASVLLPIFFFHDPSLTHPFPVPSLFSFITWKDWEWRHRQEDLEDHRFWPGQGVAQNHKNVSCRHLLLDGSWGHQVISLLQRQWRLGVWQTTHHTQTQEYKISAITQSVWHDSSFLC